MVAQQQHEGQLRTCDALGPGLEAAIGRSRQGSTVQGSTATWTGSKGNGVPWPCCGLGQHHTFEKGRLWGCSRSEAEEARWASCTVPRQLQSWRADFRPDGRATWCKQTASVPI